MCQQWIHVSLSPIDFWQLQENFFYYRYLCPTLWLLAALFHPRFLTSLNQSTFWSPSSSLSLKPFHRTLNSFLYFQFNTPKSLQHLLVGGQSIPGFEWLLLDNMLSWSACADCSKQLLKLVFLPLSLSRWTNRIFVL